MSIVLTDQQKAAVEMVKNHSFSVLTGKPGTGKTTATVKILEWAISEQLIVTQCAPTGKAAKRMMEATEFPAATIHSTLQCIFENNKFFFKHNVKNPLKTDLIIVDEASMITNELMASLMRAIDVERTRILLIGDTGQLPAVGPGDILRDILACDKIPHTELDIIHRNSGSIVEICAKIHAGEVYQPAKKLDTEAENPINLIHLERHAPEIILNAIKSIIKDRMPNRDFDPIWDVQVISPVNSRGQLSCDSLNEALQNHLNPLRSTWDAEYQFRPGDKIINTKNKQVATTDNTIIYAVNGDIGRVEEIGDKRMIVTFFAPDREVFINKKDKDIRLAYGITCHRMQGSEAPVIIIPIHPSFGYFVTRKWLYTAISRAKKICITVGDSSAIPKIINNTSGMDRCTKLKEKLIHGFERIERAELEKEFADI